MATWILIFTFATSTNYNFNQPILMDSFTTREQCEATLEHVRTSFLLQGVEGRGYCWGEAK